MDDVQLAEKSWIPDGYYAPSKKSNYHIHVKKKQKNEHRHYMGVDSPFIDISVFLEQWIKYFKY